MQRSEPEAALKHLGGYGRGHTFLAYDRNDRGFEARWGRNRRIPLPPRTPCSNPLDMPFQRLRTKNRTGTMSLDEELLRAIIGQFTIKAAASLPFSEIFQKLQKDNAHLTYLLYNDPDYVWSYIRCYPEQFAVDRDPRYPENVWYLSNCKLVAKSDRRRYQRELEEGNIPAAPNKSSDEEWNKVRYDVDLERQSFAQIYAIFYQTKSKFKTDPSYSSHLPITFLRTTLESGQVPQLVRSYMGENVEEFLYRRMHVFNVFGNQVSLRQTMYVDAIRTMTEYLLDNQGSSQIWRFYEFFSSSPDLGQIAAKYIFCESGKMTLDNFLMSLHAHKLLFRLRPRDHVVELRHGVVPVFLMTDIQNVPLYDTVKDVKRVEDLEPAQSKEQDADGPSGFGRSDEGQCVLTRPSYYTERWLKENFSGRTASKTTEYENAESDLEESFSEATSITETQTRPSRGTTAASGGGRPTVKKSSSNYESCPTSIASINGKYNNDDSYHNEWNNCY